MELKNELRVLDVLANMGENANTFDDLKELVAAIKHYTIKPEDDVVLTEVQDIIAMAVSRIITSEFAFLGEGDTKSFGCQVAMSMLEYLTDQDYLQVFPLTMLLNPDRAELLSKAVSVSKEQSSVFIERARAQQLSYKERLDVIVQKDESDAKSAEMNMLKKHIKFLGDIVSGRKELGLMITDKKVV